jgi:hypothetical protein
MERRTYPKTNDLPENSREDAGYKETHHSWDPGQFFDEEIWNNLIRLLYLAQ